MAKPLDLSKEFKPPKGQQYLLKSIITKSTCKDCVEAIENNFGVFDSVEDATKYFEEFIKPYLDVNIMLVPMCKWTYFVDNRESLNKTKDIIYREEKMNEIAKEYNEQTIQADKLEKERQKEQINEAKKNDKFNMLEKSNNPDDKIKLSIKQKLELKNKANKKQTEQNINDANVQLDRIKELYDKL